MKDLKTTNTLLLFIVIPLAFYLLKLLSFIFIPLIFSMFIALLFLPLMRWLTRKKVPKPIGVFLVIVIIVGFLKLGGEMVQLTTNEIMATQESFMDKAETKIVELIVLVESFFGMERVQGENVLKHYFKDNSLMKNFGSTFQFLRSTVTMTLMTVFFVVLLLSESFNFEKLLKSTIFKHRHTSIKTFMKIEKDILKFVIVKFVISLFTGIGFGLACLFFDVSFPLFWGLFAFLINFVQMVGSVIAVVLLSLFAFVELDPTGTLLFFIIVIIGVQVLMGGVLEPIFMGKTFSLNVITVLVMLMLWGYIWGIPGLIMSIPITVFIKILLEQFPKTKMIADLMSGSDTGISFRKRA
ncbi:AI-2E family transporter [Lentimicrobium sp. L6]|uniref:AI-2E family transporter n=1 Tax=Lentimicrobium sp. L6 TaxID=2735916 RepID=UPI0015554909|nr:AI-2E family transporter [Lentimicrobium sp. L6]NPD83981.1 AI-2E family transporter [Lentimicrobium sp. L6]